MYRGFLRLSGLSHWFESSTATLNPGADMACRASPLHCFQSFYHHSWNNIELEMAGIQIGMKVVAMSIMANHVMDLIFTRRYFVKYLSNTFSPSLMFMSGVISNKCQILKLCCSQEIWESEFGIYPDALGIRVMILLKVASDKSFQNVSRADEGDWTHIYEIWSWVPFNFIEGILAYE